MDVLSTFPLKEKAEENRNGYVVIKDVNTNQLGKRVVVKRWKVQNAPPPSAGLS
jgi:hypothetical protein